MCAHTHKCTPVIEIGSVDCALLLADRLSATFFQHLLLDLPDSGEGLVKVWRITLYTYSSSRMDRMQSGLSRARAKL